MTPVGPTKGRKLKYSICVSGAASGETVTSSAHLAGDLGRSIAERGQILTTGATVGLPYYAAVAAKEAGGMSIGFSPAESFREHFHKYRLPSSCFDFINYTGMHYAGRDLYLVQSSDAVITVGGRFGSLHEFTSALEYHKPCGILLGSGGTADMIPDLMKILEPPHRSLIVYDDNPDRLVEKLLAILEEKYEDITKQLHDHDEEWFLKLDKMNHDG